VLRGNAYNPRRRCRIDQFKRFGPVPDQLMRREPALQQQWEFIDVGIVSFFTAFSSEAFDPLRSDPATIDERRFPGTASGRKSRRVPQSTWWLAGLLGASPIASATAPYSNWLSEVWKRSVEGEVVYAAANDKHLTALCVQVDGNGSWLPAELLADIAMPKLDDVAVMHGMGLMHVEQFVPGWGNWGLSVMVTSSLVEDSGTIKAGPTYFFVLEGTRVVYRVLQQWVPATDGSNTSHSDEQWVSIDAKTVRHAPCRPRS
jgi:hypothetical protein